MNGYYIFMWRTADRGPNLIEKATVDASTWFHINDFSLCYFIFICVLDLHLITLLKIVQLNEWKYCFLLSQLDDWVLCRVRTKGNMSKNTCEDQDGCRMELPRYLPKIEVQPTYINYRSDTITDCLYNECQVLASILASQALPPIQSISSVSFEGSNIANNYT